MDFLQVTEDKKRYLPLLLLADEQESMIDRYLEQGDLFALYDDLRRLRQGRGRSGDQKPGHRSRLSGDGLRPRHGGLCLSFLSSQLSPYAGGNGRQSPHPPLLPEMRLYRGFPGQEFFHRQLRSSHLGGRQTADRYGLFGKIYLIYPRTYGDFP